MTASGDPVGGVARRPPIPINKWSRCKRGKTGGGMNLRFTGGHELDLF